MTPTPNRHIRHILIKANSLESPESAKKNADYCSGKFIALQNLFEQTSISADLQNASRLAFAAPLEVLKLLLVGYMKQLQQEKGNSVTNFSFIAIKRIIISLFGEVLKIIIFKLVKLQNLARILFQHNVTSQQTYKTAKEQSQKNLLFCSSAISNQPLKISKFFAGTGEYIPLVNHKVGPHHQTDKSIRTSQPQPPAIIGHPTKAVHITDKQLRH